jgi:hypothetical protein
MACSQFKTVITSDKDIIDLKQTISDKIEASINFYETIFVKISDVDFIEVRLRRVNTTLISDLKLDPILNSFSQRNL